MGIKLVSTDFNSRDYYTNIRKALVAGYFMQVGLCSDAMPASHITDMILEAPQLSSVCVPA